MLKHNISMSEDTSALLDTLCEENGLNRSNMIQFMIRNWGRRNLASASSTKTKEPKPEKPKPAGHDGVMKYMQSNNPATLPVGSRWWMKQPNALPPLDTLPWALRPPEVAERVKPSKANPSGLKTTCPLPTTEQFGPTCPNEFYVTPDDIEDPESSTWRVLRRANVPIPGVTMIANNRWTIQQWNAAMDSWVPDPDDVAAMRDDTKRPPEADNMWLNQHAYGAPDVETLKELLSKMAGQYNLTSDALAFIGMGNEDEENKVA